MRIVLALVLIFLVHLVLAHADDDDHSSTPCICNCSVGRAPCPDVTLNVPPCPSLTCPAPEVCPKVVKYGRVHHDGRWAGNVQWQLVMVAP